MDNTHLRKSELYAVLHTSGLPGKDVKVVFGPEDTLIAQGQVTDRFYFIYDGTVGVVSNGDTIPDRQLIEATGRRDANPFAVIGARHYFSRTPSRHGYFALTTVRGFCIDSRLLATKLNERKITAIVRALMHDSDVSDELKRRLLRELNIIVTDDMTPADVDRMIATFDGAMPGGSYESAASAVVMRMLERRISASDDPSLIISPPRG